MCCATLLSPFSSWRDCGYVLCVASCLPHALLPHLAECSEHKDTGLPSYDIPWSGVSPLPQIKFCLSWVIRLGWFQWLISASGMQKMPRLERPGSQSMGYEPVISWAPCESLLEILGPKTRPKDLCFTKISRWFRHPVKTEKRLLRWRVKRSQLAQVMSYLSLWGLDYLRGCLVF